jgi:hypothetical protein
MSPLTLLIGTHIKSSGAPLLARPLEHYVGLRRVVSLAVVLIQF